MSTGVGIEIALPEGKETRSNPKFVPYVAPRIDSDFYQVDVPALLGHPPQEKFRPQDWYKSTRAIHRPAVLDFPGVPGL